MAGIGQATAAAPGPVPPAHPPGAEHAPAAEDLGLVDAARRLVEEGTAAAKSTGTTLQALAGLAGAEARLAGTAALRAAIFGAAAAIIALVAVFYLFATLAAAIVALGLGWLPALAIVTGLLLLTAAVLAWRVVAMTRLMRFDGTRRQMTRLREGTP